MKQILFVDDDPVVIAIYRERLMRDGFHIEVAEDGVAAMEWLKTRKPSLVILDLMLPKANGVEVLKCIRGDERLRGLPVVVLSNAYLTDMAARAMLAGANKALPKNQCTPAKLLQVVRSFLLETGSGNGAVNPGSGGNSPSMAAPSAADATEDESEREILAKARAAFLDQASAKVGRIRELCLAYVKSAATPSGRMHLHKLFQKVHFISTRAGLVGCHRIHMLAAAFEAMLFEMAAKPASVTASVLQTIAQATDCLGRLLNNAADASTATALEARVLVVDDDEVCVFFVVNTLKRIGLEVAGVKQPQEALQRLEAERYDIVLLDINMPGMDGFDVCKRLRRLPHHQNVPVIFITNDGKFENRVQGVLSGGNEFVTKPVIPLELALKTMTLLLDAKLKQSGAAPAAPQVATVASAANPPPPLVAPATRRANVEPAEVVPSAQPVVLDAVAPSVHRVLQPATAAPGLIHARLGVEVAPAVMGSPRPNGHAHHRRGKPGLAVAPSVTGERKAGGSGEPSTPPHLAASPQCASDEEVNLRKALHERERAVEELRREKETLESAGKARAAELVSLQTRWQQETNEHARGVEQWQRERKELEQRLQTETRERERLASRLAEAIRLRDEADGKARTVEAEAANQREQLAARTLAAEALQQREKELNSAVKKLSTRERELCAQLEQQTRQESQWQRRHAELDQARTSLAEEVTKQKQAEAELRKALQEAQARAQSQGEALSAEQAKQAASTQELAALKNRCAESEQQTRTVNASLAQAQAELAQQAEARAKAEAVVAELSGLRSSLEAELAQHTQAEAELRKMLQEAQAQAQAQSEALSAEQAKQAASMEKLAALKDRCAESEQQVRTVNASLAQAQAELAQQTEARAKAEGVVAELSGLRSSLEAELAQHTQAEAELRKMLQEAQAQAQAQSEALSAEQAKRAADHRELNAAQAAAAESQRAREALEEQLRKQTAELERAILTLNAEQADTLRQAERAREELAALQTRWDEQSREHDRQVQQWEAKEQANRARIQTAIEERDCVAAELRDAVQQRDQAEARVQAVEAKATDAARQREAEFKSKVGALSARVGQLQVQLKEQVVRTEQSEQRALGLEQDLARHAGAEERLRRELADARTLAHAQADTLSAERGRLETANKDLQAARAAVAEFQQAGRILEQRLEKQAAELTRVAAALDAEQTARREAEHARAELTDARDRLQRELLAQTEKTAAGQRDQKALEDLLQTETTERERVAVRLDEAIRSRDEVHVRVQTLEARAAELAGLRSALETELQQRTQTETGLRQAVKELQARLRKQGDVLSAEQVRLAAQTQELRVAQAAAEELRGVKRALEQQVTDHAAERGRIAAALEVEREDLRQARQVNADLVSTQARLESELQHHAARAREWAVDKQAFENLLQTGAQEHERLRTQLAESTRLREGAEARAQAAEGDARELAASRSSLETELAQHTQAEAELRQSAGQLQARLQEQGEALSAEQAKRASSMEELARLKDRCAESEQQARTVNALLVEARNELAQQTEARAKAEAVVAELSELRSSLEAELKQRTHAEAELRQSAGQLQARLQEQGEALSAEQARLASKVQEWQAVTRELDATRDQVEQHELEQRRLAEQAFAAERARAELTRELAAARERETAGQKTIQLLESELQQRKAEIESSQLSLQMEATEHCRMQLHSDRLEAALREATVQLKEKVAAEQSWRRRETELEGCLHRQQEQLTQSGATLALQAVEIRNARQKLEETSLIQSALCAKVQALGDTEASLLRRIGELEDQSKAADRTLAEGRRELAALRYAVLDATRLSAQLSHQHVQTMQQEAAALARTTAALLSTPLSVTQRRLTTLLQGAVDNWVKNQLESLSALGVQVESPVFQNGEFPLSEAAEGLIDSIRPVAAALGIEAEATVSGTMTGNVCGDAGHLHQLLATLATSLLELAGVRRLEMQLTAATPSAGQPEFTALLRVSSNCNVKEVGGRLAALMDDTRTLRALPAGEAESGFATGAQLAQAMNGFLGLEVEGDHELRLRVRLPLAAAPAPALIPESRVMDVEFPVQPDPDGATEPAPACAVACD